MTKQQQAEKTMTFQEFTKQVTDANGEYMLVAIEARQG